MGEYHKSVAGARYIFFLSWDEKKGAYWVNALHQGKMNIDGKDTVETGVANRLPAYQQLKEAVLHRLMEPSDLE